MADEVGPNAAVPPLEMSLVNEPPAACANATWVKVLAEITGSATVSIPMMVANRNLIEIDFMLLLLIFNI